MRVVISVALTGCLWIASSPWCLASSRIPFVPRGGSAAVKEACSSGIDRKDDLTQQVLKEIETANDDENKDNLIPLCHIPSNLESAKRDFGTGADEAYAFLRGLAASETFQKHYWHKRPLLLRAKDIRGSWVSGSFTFDRDLKLVGDSYITGHKTAEILRNGTKTDTWGFKPLKSDPKSKTTWKHVEDALKGGTIYFNTAGSLWPNLGALCRLTNAAFGIPSNINVYVTPPGTSLSVPPHTDRQDVLCFQTQGAKRWRVYAPPPRSKGKDPLNRGKAGDVLSFDELDDEPLLDIVIRPGDILYVPTGFPHTTDTSTLVDVPEGTTQESIFDDVSMHLTMGLDTHVWGLTFAHIRWSLLQRCGAKFQLNITDDDAYWTAMEMLPIGFMGGQGWIQSLENQKQGGTLNTAFRQQVVDMVKDILVRLEPNRWQTAEESSPEREAIPDDEEIGQVVDYMFTQHLKELFTIQDEMFSNIVPQDGESIIKAFQCSQKQNQVMEKFGGFSKNEAMRQAFEQRRRQRDEHRLPKHE